MTTLQVYAHRLGDPNLGKTNVQQLNQSLLTLSCYSFLGVNLKVTIANELRDQVEVFQTLEYPRFLSTLISVFVDILQNGAPVFVSTAPEQVSSILLLSWPLY